MTEATDALIERLAAEATPVRRLRPAGVRAAIAVAVVLGGMAATIVAFANMTVMAARAAALTLDVEMAGTLAT
ncbi:MAG: hypothetical protein JO326_14435, partial [Acetobacteraceae bacterium]|nr:hypothetical protein [Acetobacteraceae bacterium]